MGSLKLISYCINALIIRGIIHRNADKRTIMKAYRKLAQKWHPDNFQSDAEKARAQERFIDIAAAKDVLTDPEKRQRFDQGEDPLDPQAGGAQHHGWHQHWGGGGGEHGGFPHGRSSPFGWVAPTNKTSSITVIGYVAL